MSRPTSSASSSSASSSDSKIRSRGAFIVFEGVDRSGKSTQCKQLLSYLKNTGIKHEFLRYPDRSSQSGQLINNYLQGSKDMNDRAIHLLFAANRHEDTPKILDLLNSGTNIICDRYSFSGAAYSSAKIKQSNSASKTDKISTGVDDVKDNEKSSSSLIDWEPVMDLNWCMTCEQGLPKPDLIIYMNIDIEEAQKRGGFGNERYEKVDFLRRVQLCYKDIQKMQEKDNIWRILDANRSKEEIHNEIVDIVEKTLDGVGNKEINYM